jgi:hypothetical protein
MQKVTDLIQTVESLVTTLAIVIGGIWALREYRRRREYLWNIVIDCTKEVFPYSTGKGLLVICIDLRTIGKQVFVPGSNGLEIAIERFPSTLESKELLVWGRGTPFLKKMDILEAYLDKEDIATGNKDYKKDDSYAIDVGSTYHETFSIVVDKGFIYLIEITLHDRQCRGDRMTEYLNVSYL